MSEIDLTGLQNLVRDTTIQQNTRVLVFSMPVGFTPYMQEDPHIVLHAVNQQGLTLMVYASDPLKKFQTLDMCIEKVKMDMILAAHEVCEPGEDVPPFYVGEVYQNGFTFKVYMMDSVGKINDTKYFQRQFIAFFIEPKTRCFYQIILSAAPVAFPPQKGVLVGRYNTSNPDTNTAKMLSYLESVIQYVMYRNNTDMHSNMF